MSDEKYAEQETTAKTDNRITETMPAQEGEGEEREDDSWLYECSVTAD